MPYRLPAKGRRPTFAVAACLALSPLHTAPRGRAAAPTPGPITLRCPTHLATTQSAAAIPGWAAYRAGAASRFDSYGFYDGPVSENAELAPNGGAKRGPIETRIHNFEGHVRPIHFACRYAGTDIILEQPLPAHVRTCSIRSDDRQPDPSDSVVTCR
ncbi:STY0301 family protein [Sphingomonas sp.]|uniref:STY0301 family protein n=1 Tax=Sphingomonas sp. TaxID=28214 RepID=UPI003B3BA6D9